jgi:hypothetical protein
VQTAFSSERENDEVDGQQEGDGFKGDVSRSRGDWAALGEEFHGAMGEEKKDQAKQNLAGVDRQASRIPAAKTE